LVRQELAPIAARGVQVLVFHHGDEIVKQSTGMDDPYAALDQMPGVRRHSLDAALQQLPRGQVFLRDGHWGKRGHVIVSDSLDAVLWNQ
jgi:hypothetical protein